jgi:inhibitor of KinA
MRSSGGNMGTVRMLVAGEQGLVVEFGNAIDPAVNARVHRLARSLAARGLECVLETVPTYRSLLVLFDPLVLTRERLASEIDDLLAAPAAGEASVEGGNTVELPVLYGGEFGPDLDFVARHNGLSAEEVIAIHSSAAYLVYMLGFTPGFPYLGGMSSRLATPRLSSPRGKVPSGYALVHGGPVHIGNPSNIGIKDINTPDFGDPVTIKEGEIPVFWACGVTPQAVVMEAKPDLCIAHAPGCMFVSDRLNEELATG